VQKSSAWLLLLATAAVALAATGCGRTTASAPPRILFVSDRTGTWALYSMAPDGSDQLRVLNKVGNIDPGAEGIGIGEPELSPDGRQLLLPRHGITVVTLATGKTTQLPTGDGSTTVWSPDSREVAFADNLRGYRSTGVYVFDLDTGRRHRVLRAAYAGPVSWSPDGKWILLDRQGFGADHLWEVHPDGSGLRELPGPVGAGYAWSSDGKLTGLGSNLVVIDPSTGRRQVLRRHLGNVGYPVWSPDGKTIAYTAAKTQSDAPAIYTIASSGGAPHRLTPKGGDYYDGSPVWSPDGKSLLFVRSSDRGGIQAYANEIWTMRADGSHQRRLTWPFPSEGENVDPVWSSGSLPGRHAPRPVQARSQSGVLLRVPYLVDGIAAGNGQAAVIPFGSDGGSEAQPTPPLLIWRPGSRPRPLVGSLCGSVSQTFFAGHRLAIECAHDFLDEHHQAVLVFDLRTRIPVAAMLAYNAYFGPGTQAGTVLDGPTLSGGKIEFESSRWTGQSKRFIHSKLVGQKLWSVVGSHRRLVRSAQRLGSLVAGDHDWLVFQLANGDLAASTPTGGSRRVLPLPPLHVSLRAPPVGFLIVGHELIRLGGGRLEAWDVRSGRELLNRSVPSRAQLQAADRRLIVYTIGSDIHLLSRAGDHVIHTPAAGSPQLDYYGELPLHAALSAAGLYYAYDIKGSHFPGRVVFVPRSALPR
jgi:Tol biopolymer transport system component